MYSRANAKGESGYANSLPGPGDPRDERVMPPRLPREEIEQRCKHRHLLSSESEQHRLHAGQIEPGSRVYGMSTCTYPGNTRPGSGRWTLSAPSIAEHYLPSPSGAQILEWPAQLGLKWPGQLVSDSHPS